MIRKAGKRRGGGTVTVLVAVTLTGILSAVAVALDGGLMLDNRRRVQAAADAAALAAAADLYANYAAHSGYDNATSTAESGGITGSSGPAALSAQSTALANVPNSSVTVNIPPTSGTYNLMAGYAEAIVTYNQSRGFSAIFGSGAIPISARAVAVGKKGSPAPAILLLDPTGPDAFSMTNGHLTVTNGSITVDSNNSSKEALLLQTSAFVTAPAIDIYTGGTSLIKGTASVTPTTISARVADPIVAAGISAPSPGTGPGL